MQRAYPSRINWENEPSTTSPINDTNLNKMDSALYTIDGRVVDFDTSKANQSDLLTCLSNVDYNTTTGVFTFTWKNGTTTQVDLNVEKIPVSFSMDANGVITMTTADGSTYTADVSSLIKTYTFTDSSRIDFTVTTDSSGNKTVTADIVDGSITAAKFDPNVIGDISSAAQYASIASDGAEDSEAWAVGKRNGVDVPPTDPAYHNNSKYWSEQSAAQTLGGLSDVSINNSTLANGDTIKWNTTSSQWENSPSGGGSNDYVTLEPVTEITSSNPDLNNYTTPGNYYKKDSTFAAQHSPLSNNGSLFRLRVDKVFDELYSQTIYASNNTGVAYATRFYVFYDQTQEWTWGTWIIPAARNTYLSTFATVTFSNVAIGQVLKFTTSSGYLQNDYISACAYDSTHSVADIIGDVETLLSQL